MYELPRSGNDLDYMLFIVLRRLQERLVASEARYGAGRELILKETFSQSTSLCGEVR